MTVVRAVSKIASIFMTPPTARFWPGADIPRSSRTPGANLSEVQLSEELGASRTPVREAIRRLAREGLVDFVPGEVARVAAISLAGVRALFEFRMLLEPRAAESVATAGAADERLLVPFRELLERLEAFDESFRALRPAAQARSYQEFYEDLRGRPIAISHAGAQVAARTVFQPDTWPLQVTAHHPTGARKAGPLVAQDIVGPLCFAGDLIARARPLPALAAGDVVAILDTGAYCFSAPYRFNTLPEPAVYGVRPGPRGDVRFELLRPAQTIDDLLTGS